MVSGIEPRPLEDDLGGGDDLLQRLLAALRAGFQRGVSEGLLAFELNSTIFATVGIDGHTFFSLLLHDFL